MGRSRTLSVATIAALSMTGLGASTAAAAPVPPGAESQVKTSVDRKADDSKKIVKRIMKRLPKDWRSRQTAAFESIGVERQPQQKVAIAKIKKSAAAARAGKRVIDPTAYECGPTPFNTWIDGILQDLDPETMGFLYDMGALDLQTYDAAVFGAPNDGHHDLTAGSRADLTSSFGTLQGFWDVELDDIELLAMDRNIFSKTDRMAQTLGWLFEVDSADATAIAKDVQNLINSDPALDGGKHPIFTLNAFAASLGGGVTDKVIFGDGMLQALNETGHGEVGPEAVMSHEMAHHVQFENGVQGPATPEGTRSTELGADAFGSYAGAHPKGLNESTEDLMAYQSLAYDIGDCNFDSDGHHGTPNQRKAAAAWGAAQHENQADPNLIQPSLVLEAQFQAALPTLTAPDAATNVRSYLTKGRKAA